MKLSRMSLGIAILCASAWIASAVSGYLGTDTLWRSVTVAGAVCFVAGAVFFSGGKR